MPRISNYPTLFDELPAITTSLLRRYGYLKPNQIQKGTITWSSNGAKTASVSVEVNTISDTPYILLDYKYKEAPINYFIKLYAVPSNLGKGEVWFFICPSTKKPCRKLHLATSHFVHRSAFSGAFYEKQVQSKHWRFLDRTALGKEFKLERIYEKVYKKHFKKQYAGKPTKKFEHLAKKAMQSGDRSLYALLQNISPQQ